MYVSVVLTIAAGIYCISVVDADPVKCGVEVCNENHYCSSLDKKCYPCSDVCNEETQNFDPGECRRICLDYMYDARYVKKKDLSPKELITEDLQATLQRLKSTLTITLSLLCMILIILFIYASIKIWKWKKVFSKKTLCNIREKMCVKSTTNDTKTITRIGSLIPQFGGKPDLKIDIPSLIKQNGNKTPSSISKDRLPAEDSTLDYVYVNRAAT